MVCASSTSGMAARWAVTGSCPCRWLISRVTKLVTPNPIAAGDDLRAEALDHAPLDQLVQPGLHGAPGHAEPPGALQHPDPRLLGEQFDQPRVQRVELYILLSIHG